MYDFRNHRVARILGMSRSDALALLGFPSTASPSEAELKAAQKKKIIENHPDRGGDPELMVQINRAFDFLMEGENSGSGSPEYGSSDFDSNWQPYEQLDKELDKINIKKAGWWVKGHNLAISVPMQGLWQQRFSIVSWNPYSRSKALKGFAPAGKLGDHPDGVIIEPSWALTTRSTYDSTPAVLDKLIKACRSAATIKESVAADIRDIETHHSISVPASIKAKLINEADKMAIRRWGADNLKLKPIILGFDGSVWDVRSFDVKKVK